jgi:hypothetical protein
MRDRSAVGDVELSHAPVRVHHPMPRGDSNTVAGLRARTPTGYSRATGHGGFSKTQMNGFWPHNAVFYRAMVVIQVSDPISGKSTAGLGLQRSLSGEGDNLAERPPWAQPRCPACRVGAHGPPRKGRGTGRSRRRNAPTTGWRYRPSTGPTERSSRRAHRCPAGWARSC